MAHEDILLGNAYDDEMEDYRNYYTEPMDIVLNYCGQNRRGSDIILLLLEQNPDIYTWDESYFKRAKNCSSRVEKIITDGFIDNNKSYDRYQHSKKTKPTFKKIRSQEQQNTQLEKYQEIF